MIFDYFNSSFYSANIDFLELKLNFDYSAVFQRLLGCFDVLHPEKFESGVLGLLVLELVLVLVLEQTLRRTLRKIRIRAQILTMQQAIISFDNLIIIKNVH